MTIPDAQKLPGSRSRHPDSRRDPSTSDPGPGTIPGPAPALARWKDCLPARSIPVMSGCENSRAVQCLWWRRQCTRRQGGRVVRWQVAIAALLLASVAAAALTAAALACVLHGGVQPAPLHALGGPSSRHVVVHLQSTGAGRSGVAPTATTAQCSHNHDNRQRS